MLSAQEQNMFISNISNLYRKNTTKATKMCFCTGIVDPSNYPMLHSFLPYPSRMPSVCAVSVFNSETSYITKMCKQTSVFWADYRVRVVLEVSAAIDDCFVKTRWMWYCLPVGWCNRYRHCDIMFVEIMVELFQFSKKKLKCDRNIYSF